jgi:hypothetical protein
MDNEGDPLGEYCGENNGHSGTVCSIVKM